MHVKVSNQGHTMMLDIDTTQPMSLVSINVLLPYKLQDIAQTRF